MQTTISIVEDDDYFVEVLKDTLGKDDHFLVKENYSDYKSAKIGFGQNPTDVLLVDIQLPDESGILLIQHLKEKYPQVHFIICSSHMDEKNIFNALKAGAIGYILKSEPFQSINASIHEAMNGGAPMSKSVARMVVNFFHKITSPELPILTSKENEIIALLADGFLYKEIADKLRISLDTVKKHTSNIYKKLHVNNKTEAINIFLER